MAKTKYDFTQITQYGSIIYRDVPSYSPDFLGTAGDAVLVRQFIKNYLPFYKTSVTSSTGSSIRVNIVETAWFANYYTINNSVTKVNLDSGWLGDIIEPLFEGKGFDGMQDLEYSKPLPKLINTSDPNQDVSYGHNYIFVDAKDLIYKGYINLGDRLGKGYRYEIFDLGNNVIKTGYVNIPKIIVQYIKGEMTAPNEGDLVTLEKEEENPTFQRSFNNIEAAVLKLLKRGYALTLTEIVKFLRLEKFYISGIIDAISSLQVDGYVDVVDPTKKRLKYDITQKGKNSISITGKISSTTPTVPVSAADLSSFEKLLVDYLYTNGESPLQEIQSNFNYQSREWVKDRIDELLDKGVVKFVGKYKNQTYYNITSTGLVSTDALVASSSDEQMKVLNALWSFNIAIGVNDLAVITEYPVDLVINVVNGLVVFKLIDVVKTSIQVTDRRYAINKLGKEYLEKKNRQNRKANIATPTNPIKEFDTILEQEIIDFLAKTQQQKIDMPMVDIIAEFESQNYEVNLIIEKVDNLVNQGFLFAAKSFNEVYYYPTPKGLERVTPSSILTLTQLYILELLTKKTTVDGSVKLYKNELVKMSSSAYDEDMIDDILRVLIDLNYVNQVQITNTSYQYNITELGFIYLNPNLTPATNAALTTLEQEILNFLAEKQKQKVDVLLDEIISEFQNRNYDKDLITNRIGNLLMEDLVDTKIVTAQTISQELFYIPSEKGLKLVTRKNSNLQEAKETFVDSLSSAADGGIYKNAVYEFMNTNSDAFKTMGKEDPDLYSAILGGLSFVLGQQSIKDIALEPFKPVENQQELEDDLISEDDLGDLDLGDLDLEEIDLSGLEDDIQINDEDLGDLSDFDELKNFVDSELMPSITPFQKQLLFIVNVAETGTHSGALLQEIFALLDDKPKGYIIQDEGFGNSNTLAYDLSILREDGYLIESFIDEGITYSLSDKAKQEIGLGASPFANAPEVQLLPSQYNVLKVLYHNNKTYPMAANMNADSIGIVLKQDNIIYTHKQILKKLEELVDFEFVKMKNDQIGGIMFSIRVDGIVYVENELEAAPEVKLLPSQITTMGALRPSPSESATINNIGTIKTGNDGHPWEVKENKNGVKRWVKL